MEIIIVKFKIVRMNRYLFNILPWHSVAYIILWGVYRYFNQALIAIYRFKVVWWRMRKVKIIDILVVVRLVTRI